MRFAEAIRVAIDALRANRLRSVLTMLGVIIGVGAVVVLVAIGSGAKQEVEAQVEGLGSNIIFVFPGSVEFGAAPSISRLELEDVEYLGRVAGNPDVVTATVSSGETVSVGSTEVFSTISGTNENYPSRSSASTASTCWRSRRRPSTTSSRFVAGCWTHCARSIRTRSSRP